MDNFICKVYIYIKYIKYIPVVLQSQQSDKAPAIHRDNTWGSFDINKEELPPPIRLIKDKLVKQH